MRRLLVANRAEIASRVFRTARALGIATVAVFSDADADLPYVNEADAAVRLPGNTPADTYLNVQALLAAATRSGADAVHPGYGFLSENAGFARACTEAGLTFVGPPPSSIEAMGSKLGAKQIMAAAGVPVLPGGVVTSAADVLTVAETAGWPLLLKASAGGGGRGMRRLDGPDGIAEALQSTQREALNAFGDSTIFAERLLTAPRHIEVQVFGDTAGNVVHLFERECSVQRRYQKVIEESPSVAVTPELRASLGAAAVSAAKAIGYVGAGTVEFVLEGEEFYFLEVNTRLQVEHPVTEAVTGLDLVELQLRVASGESLPEGVLKATVSGHAIEARLYAEDVAAGYLPVAGELLKFIVAQDHDIRVDTGYASGSVVSPHYDAMLAKVIAWAPDRATASARLAATLDAAIIHGVTTNRDLLVTVLRNSAWLAGDIDTGFLGRLESTGPVGAPGTGEVAQAAVPSTSALMADAVHAAATALVGHALRRASATVQSSIPSGWRNVRSTNQTVAYRTTNGQLDVDYRVMATGEAVVVVSRVQDAGVGAGVGGGAGVGSGDGAGSWQLRVVQATVDTATVEYGLERWQVSLAHYRASDSIYADSTLGHTCMKEVARFGSRSAIAAVGTLSAPMPGTVSRVLVATGDHVVAGTVLMYLEAMKMEHPVRAGTSGVLSELRVAPGTQVKAGDVLGIVSGREDGPSAEQRSASGGSAEQRSASGGSADRN